MWYISVCPHAARPELMRRRLLHVLVGKSAMKYFDLDQVEVADGHCYTAEAIRQLGAERFRVSSPRLACLSKFLPCESPEGFPIHGGWRAAATLFMTYKDGSEGRLVIDHQFDRWASRRDGQGDRVLLPGFMEAINRLVRESSA